MLVLINNILEKLWFLTDEAMENWLWIIYTKALTRQYRNR